MPIKPKKTARDDDRIQKAVEAVKVQEEFRLTADIPLELHKKLKVLSAQKGVKLRVAIIDALEEYLRKNGIQ